MPLYPPKEDNPYGDCSTCQAREYCKHEADECHWPYECANAACATWLGLEPSFGGVVTAEFHERQICQQINAGLMPPYIFVGDEGVVLVKHTHVQMTPRN